MAMQFILTIILISYAVYALFQRQNAHYVSEVTSFAALLGLLLVWRPDTATTIAHWVGVGRGADLVFYCFILAGLIVSFHLHLCIKRSNQLITELARAVALQNPINPQNSK